jgi:Fe-S cluster assembly protein SufD
LARFSEAEGRLSGRGLSWLDKARRSAISRFSELGFPGETNEDWRFTRVDPIASASFALPQEVKAETIDFRRRQLANIDAHRLVFIDGRLAPSLSAVSGLPAGIRIGSLAEALKSEPSLLEPYLGGSAPEQAFAALNAAFFDDGALIWIPRGLALDKPVHLLFISTASASPVMWNGRVLLVAETGSKVSILEEYASGGEGIYFANMVTELFIGENASVDYVKVQRDNDKSFHVAGLRARQERDSALNAHSISLGAALCRNDINVSLAGPGADCSLDGLYLAGGRQHVDFHTVIDHAAAHCSSRELFKGVLDGRARAVFNGLVRVQPGAQKTSAMLYNKNLLLSEEGLVNTKPEFKIYANDVQCKHGATVGQLSADALFYLRSRGIGAEAARRLLVYAFGREMVEKISLAPVREALSDVLAQSFRGGD